MIYYWKQMLSKHHYSKLTCLVAGQVCKLYKNGGLTDTTVCPSHVDLHETYEIGHVDNWFQGVIDEVSFFSFALNEEDVGPIYAIASAGMSPMNSAAAAAVRHCRPIVDIQTC